MCHAYITNTGQRSRSTSAVHVFWANKKKSHTGFARSGVNRCTSSLSGAADMLSCAQGDGASSYKTLFQAVLWFGSRWKKSSEKKNLS